MKFFWQLGILFMLPIVTYQRSFSSSPSYIGAVAEYSPERQPKDGKSPRELNTENYLKFIDKASEYAVDILVFPESSLSIASSKNSTVARSEAASYIPDPQDKVIPCDDEKETYAYSIKNISCAAKYHGIYIVINHREKVDCAGTDCPHDGFLIYNSNVVFDRNGRVIARYRKYNLFGERGTNATSIPVPSIFETDFGVTFGQFICFDILFETPTLNFTRDLGITDIVFSSNWFSESPYLFAVEAQAAWAYANDANLLSSGLNYPRTASGGSGIYIGRKGYSKVIYENKASNILIISEIPKVVDGKRALNINQQMTQIYKFTKSEISTTETNGTGIYLHKTDNLIPYTTELIDIKQSAYNKTICSRELCCNIDLKIKFDDSVIKNNTDYYRYRFAVFNGVRSFSGVATGGVKTCGIISCINESLDGCDTLLDLDAKIVTPTIFESIEISMKNMDNQNMFFMPITFSKNMMPLNATDFLYESINSEEFSDYSMSLTKPRSDLLTFTIYGRNFALDGTEETSSSTKNLVSPLFLLIASLTAILACFIKR